MSCVYRIYSEAGEPLYVGTTRRKWWVRVAEQAGKHPEIAATAGRVDVTYHATPESAFQVEKAEIERLLPKINTRSAWHESKDYKGGELMRMVLDVVVAQGEATTSSVREALPDVRPGSVATTLMRLRNSGAVEVVGTVNGLGRPQFIVRAAA